MLRSLARLMLRLVGWRTEGAPPPDLRYVLIAAPHTSNWDALLMLAAARIFRIRISWFLKESWFVFPLSPLLRAVGAVPIDRRGAHGVVQQAVDRFSASKQLVLAVPPEGTRKKTAHWKGGFYHIARGAGVPIVLGYLDYGRKVAGLGPAFQPTGDLQADFKVFRDFYSAVKGKFPELVGEVVPPPPTAS